MKSTQASAINQRDNYKKLKICIDNTAEVL